MRIERLITALLVGATSTSCYSSTHGCERDNRDAPTFEVDQDIDAALWRELTGGYSSVLCDVACEELADVPTDDGRDLYPEACELEEFEVDSADTGGDAIAAHIRCSGHRYFTCEGRRRMKQSAIVADDLTTRGTVRAIWRMEYESVRAFEQLVHQLTALGAPSELVARCRSALRDELRHSRYFSRGVPSALPVSSSDTFTRVEVAENNVVEGCVNETWSALLASWRGRYAPSEHWRSVFRRIAHDEARHAQLAWDLHAWLSSGLNADERSRVVACYVRARTRLTPIAASATLVPTAMGAPKPAQARSLARRLVHALPAPNALYGGRHFA